MAMLTLSDAENNLHFILMARGLLEPGARGEGGHGHPAGWGQRKGCVVWGAWGSLCGVRMGAGAVPGLGPGACRGWA